MLYLFIFSLLLQKICFTLRWRPGRCLHVKVLSSHTLYFFNLSVLSNKKFNAPKFYKAFGNLGGTHRFVVEKRLHSKGFSSLLLRFDFLLQVQSYLQHPNITFFLSLTLWKKEKLEIAFWSISALPDRHD